jgi:hypothetical protein
VQGRAVAAGTVSGTVAIRAPGGRGFVTLAADGSVPVGSQVDARRGVIALTSALPGGTRQTARFWGGIFTVRQDARGAGTVTLVMPSIGRCPRRGAYTATARTPRRSLWGKDHHGRYRTKGRNSVATVRGTRWQTVESCAGTLTRVTEGRVVVRDVRRHRDVRLTAGHSYLARARR